MKSQIQQAMKVAGSGDEVMVQFKQRFPDAREYQSLSNQALREWLVAQGVKALVREALQEMTTQVVAVISNTRVSPPNTV